VLKDIRQSQEKKAMRDTNQIIIDKQPKVISDINDMRDNNQIIIDKQPKVISDMEVPKKDITKTIMTMIVFEL
jgi:hypothetical protein